MAAGADKFYPAGLGETSDARTHRSNFIRNGGIAETNKFYPAGAWVKLYKKSQNCRNLYFPLMRLGETLAQRRFVVRVGARKTRFCVR